MLYLNAILIFIIGMILGSFYKVVAERLPKNESIITPPSHCENCKKKLSWYELIPVFSYLIQKGKCRKCKEKISILYPIVELGTGLLFFYAYLSYGFSYQFFVSMILSSLLIIIYISDIKYMIILDSPLIISAILIFILKWIFFGSIEALLSIAWGLLSFLIMFAIGRFGDILFKRESLGGGDIKLSFLFGMSLGYQMAIVAFVLSTFLALPYAFASLLMKRTHEVPFGPFLVSALWIVFHFYDKFEKIMILIFNL